ncbi:Endonuclease/exonuclease/phosphatase [Chaetomidium leptoderma]|uniref:Endonuclease/exonuclease/phosphatase n=1 Tax=Chaetomidium leptoderma TaxID=669021 RepID=A0AAN6VUF9_9PEZI|nr:Endonuclease/exonuclease/phosphatase [Chaetomidium leptoderma]
MVTAGSRSLPIRLVTFNIRYATKNPGPGEEPWSVRCPRLCAQLKFITSGHDSAFVCLQEVLYSQLADIIAHLGTSWGYISQGREDGKLAGEHSPILFRLDRWVCKRSSTFWLSPTPDVPSKGWDADLERIVTMGSFRHREIGVVVVLMNTHFDHRGEVAREESARLLLKLAGTWPGEGASAASPPVFLGGDFNSTPTGRAYKVLTEPGSGIRDISSLVPDEAKYGNLEMTFTSFGNANIPPARIDFLFVRTTGVECLRFSTFGILTNRFDDGVYISDHRPVVADVEVPF